MLSEHYDKSGSISKSPWSLCSTPFPMSSPTSHHCPHQQSHLQNNRLLPPCDLQIGWCFFPTHRPTPSNYFCSFSHIRHSTPPASITPCASTALATAYKQTYVLFVVFYLIFWHTIHVWFFFSLPLGSAVTYPTAIASPSPFTCQFSCSCCSCSYVKISVSFVCWACFLVFLQAMDVIFHSWPHCASVPPPTVVAPSSHAPVSFPAVIPLVAMQKWF